MGIFDFLGDLSSKRSKELGLGGLQSLLGTRGAAQAGAIGDEMIGITNKDSLPGYFNEQTREYVPWYVDLFDGGGLNAAGTMAEQEAAQSMAARTMPGGAPMAQPGLLANNQFSDMERANRSRAAQMTPGLGSQLSDMEMANRSRSFQMTPGLGSQFSDMEMANRNRVGPAPRTPELPRVREIQSDLVKLDGGELLSKDLATPDYYLRNMKYRENIIDNPPNIAMPEEPIVPSLPNMFSSEPAPRESALNTLRENVYSVGPIDAYRNALNNRPDIPLTQPFAGRDDTPRLSDMQSPMMQHPAFPKFIELMKRTGNESSLQDPRLLQKVFDNYLRLEGL